MVYFGETQIEAFKEFEETVHLFNDDNLVFLASVNLMNKFDIADIPYVILLKTFDQKRIDYSGQIDSEALRKFINANMHPRVVKLSDATAEHVFGENSPVFFLYLSDFSS